MPVSVAKTVTDQLYAISTYRKVYVFESSGQEVRKVFSSADLELRCCLFIAALRLYPEGTVINAFYMIVILLFIWFISRHNLQVLPNSRKRMLYTGSLLQKEGGRARLDLRQR